jgi:hypothetical protein
MSKVVITIEDEPSGGMTFKAEYGELGFMPLSPAHHAGAALTHHMDTLGQRIPFDAPAQKEPENAQPILKIVQ